MPENDGVYEAWRKHNTANYMEGDRVRHNGRKFVCRDDHYPAPLTEPAEGAFWTEFWDLIEDVKFPKADVSSKLYFIPSGPDSMEQIDIDQLAKLVESGECDVRFELKYPECRPIRIAQMELIDIEETPLGTVAHFLVLRDLTDEEE